jgi:hypothetical protein
VTSKEHQGERGKVLIVYPLLSWLFALAATFPLSHVATELNRPDGTTPLAARIWWRAIAFTVVFWLSVDYWVAWRSNEERLYVEQRRWKYYALLAMAFLFVGIMFRPLIVIVSSQ